MLNPMRIRVAIALVSIAWLVWLLGGVFAHDSWINHERLTDPVSREWCCNTHDCREEPGNIEPRDGGFLIKSTGEIIARERVIWRSPGGWWRCRYMAGPEEGKTRCLIGPSMGS